MGNIKKLCLRSELILLTELVICGKITDRVAVTPSCSKFNLPKQSNCTFWWAGRGAVLVFGTKVAEVNGDLLSRCSAGQQRRSWCGMPGRGRESSTTLSDTSPAFAPPVSLLPSQPTSSLKRTIILGSHFCLPKLLCKIDFLSSTSPSFLFSIFRVFTFPFPNALSLSGDTELSVERDFSALLVCCLCVDIETCIK